MNGAGQPIPQALPNGSVSSVIIGGRSHEKREISTFDAVGIQWPSSYSTRNVSSQERTGATPRAVFKSQFSSPAVPTSVTDASASFAYAHKPPSRAIVVSTMEDFDQPLKIYRNPLYSKASDAPEKPREYAGLVYHLKGGTGLGILDNWSEVADMDGDNYGLRPNDRPQALRAHFVQGWEYTGVPPGFREVVKWARTQPASNIPTFGSKRARYLVGERRIQSSVHDSRGTRLIRLRA